MAIQKPYNLSITSSTIDGKLDNSFTWKVTGSIQTAYSFTIYKNSDNSTVFTFPKTNSYELKGAIPANTLTNGIEYKLSVTVYDLANTEATSDVVIFQTSTTPLLTFTSTTDVGSELYNATATYTQAENVPLKSYIAYLYDKDRKLINQSNIKTILPVEHLFPPLTEDMTYYVEFQATSAKGIVATTGLIMIKTSFSKKKVNLVLKAENIDSAGVKLQWFAKQIIGVTSGTTNFVNNGTGLDVRNGMISFANDFSTKRDFTFKLHIESPTVTTPYNPDNDLFVMNGKNGTLRLQYLDNNRFKLIKTVKGINSVWFSNEVISTKFVVVIQQIGDDCNIFAYKL
ncbi:hypothetical protein AB1283_00525 [Bacillus sp. S13(2024)]|uniref:hypothetical protein n=1 Tax=Bacillus sp. S13(2024) TaxID=3162885 RepID=UPI003D256CCE